MTDNSMIALEQRVSRLETQIVAGLDRIEGLLRREITELKDEQITDLRDANRRLGDDQRRLWERLTSLEQRENQRVGANRMLGGIGHFLSAAVGGLITWLATWLSGGGSPPHHP